MVANALGCSEEEVEQTFLNDQPIRSMNTPLEDGSERCLHDCLYEAGQVLADASLVAMPDGSWVMFYKLQEM